MILIITRKCQLFTSGRIRKSPLHNIEHTKPALPLQKPTSLQLQVSKSGRSIFSNLSFTFNHFGHMGEKCQIRACQMKFELLSRLLSKRQLHFKTQNSQASKQRKQNYYAATVFQSPMSSIAPVTSSSRTNDSGCSLDVQTDILRTARYILLLCHMKGKTPKHDL